MPEGEDSPPTLASLRARSAKLRPGRRPASPAQTPKSILQDGLFSAPAEPSAPRRRKVKDTELAEAVEKTPPPTAPSDERRIWTVCDVVNSIRRHVEVTYSNLWIEGEISNCRPASSGHIYFTLKDGEAQLPVVLFRRQAQLLRFRPADGLAVLVRGRVSVYETRGQLQLIAETLEPRGAGALQLAFEQLKARLRAEGLFDTGRKRSLPPFPRCAGVITSISGAVIRDIVTVVRRRHAGLNLLVYPAIMQGPSSAASVAAAIRWFNAHPALADLVILARGGGSIEDLACFNDETLARTIAASHLPIVSAIGHETDFTIADLAADLRAPTPSAAAELVTAAQHRVEERVEGLTARVHRAGRYHLIHARQRYARLSAPSVLSRLRDSVDRRGQRLVVWNDRLRRQDITVRLATTHRRLQAATQRLRQASVQTMAARETRLNRASTRLDALSPVAVLSRGYALIYSANGTLLRSSAETAAGETIHARLGHGTLEAKVTEIDSAAITGQTHPAGAPAATENRKR